MARDAPTAERDRWARESVGWARTAPAAAAGDDEQNQILIEAATIAPGMRVVDLASGTGDPAISIALRVGADGLVAATDFSPEMLAVGRRRAAALEFEHMRFAVADMTRLPFADDVFDAATCRCGIMFPQDRVAAAAEARRVLAPGGRVAYLVWGPQEDNTLYAVVRETVLRFFGEKVPAGVMQRHSLGAPGALAEVLAGAGFAAIEERAIMTSPTIAADQPFWRRRVERSYTERWDGLDEAGRAALDAAMRTAFEPWRDGAVYRLSQHARVGVGTAPP